MHSQKSAISWRNVAFGAAALALLTGLPSTSASACGGIFDVACNLQNGGMSPGNLGRQTGRILDQAGTDAGNGVQAVANALNELQASVLSGPALERAIIESHNTAINGSTPIPPDIRRQLTGYASEDSMNRVRFKIGDNGFVNLARLIEQGGGIAAVTLIDVIVFNGPSEASDPALWAHELVHVDQYRDWGVHSFAVQYTRNARGVENPAYDKGNGYWAWRQGQSQGPQVSFPGPGPSGIPGIPGRGPMQLGQFCYIQNVGRIGPGNPEPLGSDCWIDTSQGRLFGRMGQ